MKIVNLYQKFNENKEYYIFSYLLNSNSNLKYSPNIYLIIIIFHFEQ